MNRIILLSILFFWANVQALAQEGPLVPCVGCDTLVHAPFPETGAWYNPDQSGTGINVEIQNGKLLAFYYGYDAEGRPEWQLFSGLLTRSEQDGVQWELETFMSHFKDGNCIGCDYQPPADPTEGPAVKLEFQQRNYLRLTIGDNASQFYVPIIYGSPGYKYFEEQTPYIFPEYGDIFVLTFKPNADPPEPWNWNSGIFLVRKGSVAQGGPNEGQLAYSIWPPSPNADVSVGSIDCAMEEGTDLPGCKVLINSLEYVMPIANMSDSRFFGEAEDGSTVEGYRLDYD